MNASWAGGGVPPDHPTAKGASASRMAPTTRPRTTTTPALSSRTHWLAEPTDLLDALGTHGFAWLRGQTGFVTSGVALRVSVPTGPGRFETAAAKVAAVLRSIDVEDRVGLRGTGPLIVGAIPFSPDTPGELIVPAVVVGQPTDGSRAWMTRIEPVAPSAPSSFTPPRPATANANTSPDRPHPQEHPDRWSADAEPLAFRLQPLQDRQDWERLVREALLAIDGGRLAKVVLARRVAIEADRPFAIRPVIDRLRRSHPTCFTYAADRFVGSSPELLIRREGLEIASGPTAGTIPRGASIEEDDARTVLLSRSIKDAHEHRLVVDAVMHVLQPVCEELVAGVEPEMVRLATVSHLTTNVSGRLRDVGGSTPSALALAGLLHPTPAVGGWPTEAALSLIGQLEAFDRGRYAGPVGWVDESGNGEWAVALRCAELPNSEALVTAGAGIVHGSDPGAEWEETQAKLEPMLQALVRL